MSDILDDEIKYEINKIKRKVLIFGLVVLLLLVGCVGYLVYSSFFSMSNLPEGELILESKSPKSTYSIKAYRINGGATTSYNMRVELNFNQSKKKPKNIYWNYKEGTVDITWFNNDKVSINGHILNLPNERYDIRWD